MNEWIYIIILVCSAVLRMRNVSHKRFRKNQNTHLMPIKVCFPISCSLWDNVGKSGTTRQVTDDSVILRMHIECWIPKATNTLSENVTLFALALLQLLHKSPSMLQYTYIAALVSYLPSYLNCFSVIRLSIQYLLRSKVARGPLFPEFSKLLTSPLVRLLWR
jgi:hypothetical protein